MNYANIKYCDIANGTGVRTSLFVSGCRHHCPGCFNSEAWDFGYGEPFTGEIRQKILDSLKPSYIAGLSLLGGEPMEPENQRELLPFLKEGQRAFCEVTKEMLSLLEILVDGRFVEEEYDISLRFRGSKNQRLIDLPASQKAGRTVLWQDDPLFAGHEINK